MTAETHPTVAIIYGFAEGPFMARKLRRVLSQQGFNYTENVAEADLIIAHSGGCLLVPKKAKASAVLLVAPTAAWRGSMPQAMHGKVKLDRAEARANKQLRAWFKKSSYNALYMLTGMARAYRMFQRLDRNGLPVLTADRVGIITFRKDPWSRHIGTAGLHHKHDYTFVSHDRTHDDLWNHPQTYISVLQYLYAS